jgi:hypothetical protein
VNKKYDSLFMRLVANTREPENAQACWKWTGVLSHNGYPRVSVRDESREHPYHVAAHRKVLEIVHGFLFPFDEAGHLCFNRRCINPDHLEVQTKSMNSAEQLVLRNANGCLIPVLFPVEDPLQLAADRAWDGPGELGSVCPF